jgi:hypothetical protein
LATFGAEHDRRFTYATSRLPVFARTSGARPADYVLFASTSCSRTERPEHCRRVSHSSPRLQVFAQSALFGTSALLSHAWHPDPHPAHTPCNPAAHGRRGQGENTASGMLT